MTETLDRILIVEDSRTYSTTLGRKIRRRLGLPFLVATSYAEAKELVAQYGDEIFLAILDLNLPDAPNGEVVEMVTSQGITALIITATFSDSMRKKIVSRNVADYLVKESVRDIDYILGFIDRLNKNRNVKLLVADDSPSYRHMVSSFLRVHKFEVLEANDGVHALEMLEKHPDIQLVVADYKMPRMDGFELVTIIRRKFAKDEIGFVGLSAHEQESLSAKFLKKGANDFLAKPFSKEEFYCRIRQNIELIELTRKVRESAQRDYLTGLHNRPYLMEMGEKYFENAQRNNLAITVALIDIDGFQAINERFGLDAGDAVIRQVAVQIERSLRGTDIIARFDAGEFAVVAVNLSDELAQMVFERVRKNVDECAFDYEGRELHATVSIGATNMFADTLPEMLNASHESLIEAKNAGRNRVVWWRRNRS